jgi:hypothetical protein
MTKDVESTLARHTARRAVIVGPLLVAVFWAARGSRGAVAAAIGVAIVAGYYLLSGAMLSAAARISLGFYQAAALFGFFLRIGLVALTMLAVAWLFAVDRLALGISVVAAYVALLAWETIAVARGAERELEWVR